MIVVLLILHGLLAVALLGAITHQALSVLTVARATNGRWNFVDRFRGVDATAYATPIVVLFAVTAIGGALLYPQYRIDVRPALEDTQNSAANGVFEIKEHLAAIGLGMLPIYATSLSVNPRAEAVVNVDLQGVRYVEMPWFISPDHPAVMAYPQPKVPMSVESERLYAFGIDAFRIALLITKGDPRKSYIDGVTGKIGLEERHFSRSLSPAEVDGGRVIPLRPTS